MLPTLFSFIWVFQILIGYSEFLRNAYLHILFFQLGIFVNRKAFHDFTVFSDTFTLECKLLSVSIQRCLSRDTILNPSLTHL